MNHVEGRIQLALRRSFAPRVTCALIGSTVSAARLALQPNLASGCTFDLWADDIPTAAVEVRDDGAVWVCPRTRYNFGDAHWHNRLREGLEQNIGLILAKAVLGLIGGGINYRTLVRDAVLFGTRNHDGWGIGLTILTALAKLIPSLPEEESYLALYKDALAGVHLSVDVEFEANRQATIATLTGSRYANVLDSIEKAHSRLTEIPPNGKDAVRTVFAAAEGLFKLMFAKETRLTASAARRQLLPVVQRIYAGDPPALTSASKMVASFCEWVDGAHPYRHEHGSEEVAHPPLELAVNLLSLGITNVRWLAELDAKSATTVKGG